MKLGKEVKEKLLLVSFHASEILLLLCGNGIERGGIENLTALLSFFVSTIKIFIFDIKFQVKNLNVYAIFSYFFNERVCIFLGSKHISQFANLDNLG